MITSSGNANNHKSVAMVMTGKCMAQALKACFFIVFSFLTVMAQAQTDHQVDETKISSSAYRLSAGDLVRINVFNEDDLSLDTRLTDAGTISYPFLGEIRIRGLTVGQLEQLLISKLKGDYLIEPRVNVTITEYRKFFVRGEVREPGGFSFEPGLTLEKAIALAGGFTERASRRTVEVTRETTHGVEKSGMKLNKPVLPGDIVTVKESFF